GSVKSNMGHLETASGVAGLVKAIHSLQHRVVPATIGIEQPNPNLLLADWNIKLVTCNTLLKPEGTLSIGVNSFGFGGANAHVILQSAEQRLTPAQPTFNDERTCCPLIVSSRTRQGLKANASALASYLRK